MHSYSNVLVNLIALGMMLEPIGIISLLTLENGYVLKKVPCSCPFVNTTASGNSAKDDIAYLRNQLNAPNS
jgi:hypothetical protein